MMLYVLSICDFTLDYGASSVKPMELEACGRGCGCLPILNRLLDAIADYMDNSILPPPPPRAGGQSPYGTYTNNAPIPIVETSNTIRHPEGGCPLQVGEGI